MAKPDKCISPAEAQALQNNWVSTRQVAIEQSLKGQIDCREFNFSVSELQEFLDYVKDESSREQVPNPGVRIYFAAYSGENGNKATVFLAPTMGPDINSENNYNLDPLNHGMGGDPPNGYNP